jgi:hypothetical protein
MQRKILVSMRIMQWVLAAALIISGLGMLSSCEKFEAANRDVQCQWICDFAEEGISARTGLEYNRVVEVYEFFENGTGYYECYLLNGDELVSANYVRGENGNFRYEVEGDLDLRSTVAKKNAQVSLDITVYLLDRSWTPWTVRYADGLITDGEGGVFTPATEAQREQILQLYESRNVAGLSEKIIGKWIVSDIDGIPVLSNNKSVYTFVTATEAYMSVSIVPQQGEEAVWNDEKKLDVAISGNKITLINQPDEHTTMVEEFIISDINATSFTADHKIIVTIDGDEVLSNSGVIRFEKVTADYSAAIVGTWEGKVTSAQDTYGDGEEHRWEYKADGSFVYYVKDGDDWVPSANTLNEYFVDGNLLCMRWVDNGIEYREWWEIAIDGDTMNWTALRQNPDGTPFTATFSMTKVE